MPDRLIRDEILTSERYWAISIDAQRLFLHLLLSADDTGRFSGKNYTIRATCYPGRPIDPDQLEKWLTELVDIDLVRIYRSELSTNHPQERFIFIPRFKQRLRYPNSKYPAPPKEINDIPIEKTDSSQSQVSPESDSSPPKRSEEKRSEVNLNPGRDKSHASPKLQWWETESGMLAKGKQLGTEPRTGEGWTQFKERLFVTIKAKA